VITTALLVDDLARPTKFLRLLTRPNTRSWLVRGGWILSAFGATVAGTMALRWFGLDAQADMLRWVNAALGLAVAGYTAFLFRQCEGRDLWQSKVLLPHLLAQALMCGAAVLMPFASQPRELSAWFAIGLALHVACATYDSRAKHHTANANQAAAFLKVARLGPILKPYKWAMVVGTGLPPVFLAFANLHRAHAIVPELALAAAVTALAGLFLYESAYVRAGQLPPLS
jgi:formate-dependent nitrite reductase membrane component NrfD